MGSEWNYGQYNVGWLCPPSCIECFSKKENSSTLIWETHCHDNIIYFEVCYSEHLLVKLLPLINNPPCQDTDKDSWTNNRMSFLSRSGFKLLRALPAQYPTGFQCRKELGRCTNLVAQTRAGHYWRHACVPVQNSLKTRHSEASQHPFLGVTWACQPCPYSSVNVEQGTSSVDLCDRSASHENQQQHITF